MANVTNFPDTRITFIMKRNRDEVWRLTGQGPGDREMFTGLIQGIDACFDDMNKPFHFKLIIDGKGETFITNKYDEDEPPNVLRDYYELDTILEVLDDMGLPDLLEVQFLNDDYEGMREIGERYGWLTRTKNPETQYHGVDAFNTARYIQGYIMGCNACGVDFRQTRHGKPFKVAADGTVTYFDIQGYPMENPPDMPTRI